MRKPTRTNRIHKDAEDTIRNISEEKEMNFVDASKIMSDFWNGYNKKAKKRKDEYDDFFKW